MQLSLAHRAFETEQEAIVEAGRIIDAVFIENERRGQRAQFYDAMPIREVAPKLMQLRLAHDAGQAQQQAVVVGARIVKPLTIRNESAGHRAQLEKLPVPGYCGLLRAKREASPARYLRPSKPCIWSASKIGASQ